MNSYTCIARLTRDPEVKQLPNGKAVAEMRVAIDNGKKKGGEELPATFVTVKTYGGGAAPCGQYLSKGSLIGVSGRLHSREWTDDADKRHSVLEVVGRIQFLDQRNSQGEAPAASGDEGDDGVPF